MALGMLLASCGMFACAGPEREAPWETPPGWTATRGGEEGPIIPVTTLDARGPGSLAEALAAKGPRVVSFAVAGTIDLGGHSIQVKEPRVTIAGETAPSPGITLVNGGIGIATNDVIVRHLRIRPGAGGRPKKSGWEIDGLATLGAHDVIVDHCSIAWSTDENLSASGPRFEGASPDEWRKNTSRRITFSHCIVGECLHDSTHRKGPHSKGSLVHDNATDIAIIGNLYISNDDRNPLFKGGARGVVANNLVHNPGRRAMQFALNEGEWKGHEWQRGAMAIVGNVARKGPSTSPETAFIGAKGPCDLHLRDNLFIDADGTALPIGPTAPEKEARSTDAGRDGDVRLVESPPLWPPRLKARPAHETAAWVLANAGARPWERDATDRRLVEEARSGGGKIIHSESEVPEAARPR